MQTISHVRDVNNYIRKAILRGSNLSSEDDRDKVITSFLEECTTSVGKMTYELFLFFLQKLNAHALFELMDSKHYTIVYPDYKPFDIAATAEKHGFPNIYKRVEQGIKERSANLESTKHASAYYAESGEFDKVASANPMLESSIRNSDVGKAMSAKHDVATLLMRDKLAAIFWSFKNLGDFLDDPVIQRDPKRREVVKDIQSTTIRGSKDKTASVNDFNMFLDILDEYIKRV